MSSSLVILGGDALERRALKIGIIGFGKFGQFLAKTFIKQGHTLRAYSRTDYSQTCADLGITFFRDCGELIEEDNDVIMICTSILSLSEVLNSHIPFHRLRKPTLFVDVLSVKQYPREELLKVVPEDSDVLCTHPMFGPDSGKDGWRDLRFMYDPVRVRDHQRCSTFLNIFENEGCKMLEMSCEEHDKYASRTQFITHTIGRVLSLMDIHSTPIDTNSFQSLLQLKKTTENDSFDLFTGLFVHNTFAMQELNNLELAFQKLKQKLLQSMHNEEEEEEDIISSRSST